MTTTTRPLARRAFLLLGLASASVLLNACSTSVAQEETAAPATPVQVAEVPVRSIADWRDYTGEIEAQQRVDLRPRVAGYIQQVGFSEGALVKKGQLLFQIDPAPFAAQVERLRADLQRVEADQRLAGSRRERAVALLAENAISQEEHDQLAAGAAAAQAGVGSVRAALKAAELDLSYTRITAPIDGRVSRALITEGNLVDSSKVLTTLVSVDPVYVAFDVDESTYLSALDRAGQARVYVGRMNDEGTPHEAKLDFVDNVSREGVIRLRATLDNAAGAFTPGLFARVRLVAGKEFDAALVDDKAIGTDLDKKYVLVVSNANVAEYRGVTLGARLDGLRVVTAGLKAGDVIVVNGLQHVKPGAAVAPTRVAMGGEGEASRKLTRGDAVAPVAESAPTSTGTVRTDSAGPAPASTTPVRKGVRQAAVEAQADVVPLQVAWTASIGTVPRAASSRGEKPFDATANEFGAVP
ncbi:efflux RND transporter periplasmic adaptor subunit [Solimonas sp. K1W22B-7]|nr:efflux RND transporter periplasmic adaptor subunit [Solimonas sp. K1W22B-7]AXQ27470.1 efflux RND transporter periplasmic adaptor subunit [Solimonas sp. K1W22B-7]